MMYGMSPLRRALYFILPLVLGLVLTSIVLIDAANTPPPNAPDVEALVEEGHRWVYFEFDQEAYPSLPVAGTVVTVALPGRTFVGELPEAKSGLLFDLGEEAEILNVVIEWPDGREQRYGSIPLDARYQVNYPRTATAAIGQWFEMNGPLYRVGGYVLLGILLVLLAVRVVVWAENRRDIHLHA